MITTFERNQVTTTPSEEDLAVTEALSYPSRSAQAEPESTRQGLDQVAFQMAQSFDAAVRAVVDGAFAIGRTLLQMKKDIKRTEYQAFLSQSGWTANKVSKYLKLVKTFEGFSLDQIGRISLDTLFTLCGRRYQELVVKLREIPSFTQELVERLMKECRPLKEPKQQKAPITGWKQNPSGGGRHYCVLLHDEDTGIKIEQLAAWQGMLPQRVISDAITASHKLQLALRNAAQKFPFSTWEEVAEFVGRDHNQLISLAKNWTPEERSLLVDLFSAHLGSYPGALDVEIQWVPKNLLEKALSNLSFVVQKIGGPNNLVDGPEIEHIRGCRFVSLKHLGTRHEQWIFALKNKLYSVFGRDEFAIER